MLSWSCPCTDEQDGDQDWEAQHESLAKNLEYAISGHSNPEYDVDQHHWLGFEDDDSVYQLSDVSVHVLIIESDSNV